MKNAVILLTILFGIGSITLAETDAKPRRTIDTKYNDLRTQAGLSNAQFSRILSIESKYADQLPKSPKNEWTSREIEKASRLLKAERQEVLQVLTPQQRIELERAKAPLRERRIHPAEQSYKTPRSN